MESFPYQPRKYQFEIISLIQKTIESHSHIVLESGTGTGKTICVLVGCVPFARAHKKKIIYTTRTNAQQRQVIHELRAVRKQMNDSQVFGIGLQGRNNMCLLARNNPELESGTADELARYCTLKKKKTKEKKSDGCVYYANFLTNPELVDSADEWAKRKMPTAEECVDYCYEKQLCPYEINKQLITNAVVVVIPYVYFFDRTIRIMLFDWLGIADDDAIVIVDEAHNLPEYLRDLFSARLSVYMLKSCEFEAEKYGDPSLADTKHQVSGFCTMLKDIILGLRDTYIHGITEETIQTSTPENGDALIPSHEVEAELQSRLHLSKNQLHDCISDLIVYGKKIQEYRQKQNKLPRSYIHKLGEFLDFWMQVEAHQYVRLIVDETQGKNPHIEAFCLDASIGADVFKDIHASVHMSGTLEPLEEYRDSLALHQKTTVLKSYPSPFPRHHRRIYYVSDVTTRYEDISKDPTVIPRIWNYIQRISNTFTRNTMIFLPSFNILKKLQIDGSFDELEHCVYIEEQSISQKEIMQLVSDFKACGDDGKAKGTFFSVIGGRISEGMDFPAQQLEIIIIVGIPYPKPTARQKALQRYYDIKFGKGWEYTVEAPAARKLIQAIGRLIRDENDLGVIAILDKRALRFRHFIKDLQESKNLVSDIHRFFHIYHKFSPSRK